MTKHTKRMACSLVTLATLAGCGAIQPTQFHVVDMMTGAPIQGCSMSYSVTSGTLTGAESLAPGEGFVGSTNSDGSISVPRLPQHNQYHFYFSQAGYWGADADWDLGSSEVDVASPDSEEIGRFAGKIMPADWSQKDAVFAVNEVVIIRLHTKSGTEKLQDVSDWLKEHLPGVGSGTVDAHP